MSWNLESGSKATEVREKIFDLTFAAAESLSQKTRLLEAAWENFGISQNVPMDGSRDGDITTLHINGRFRSRLEDIEIVENEEVEDDSDELSLFLENDSE